MKVTFEFAIQRFRFSVGRMLSSVLAIALGVALVVAVQMMNGSVLRSFLATIDETTGRAVLSVVTENGFTLPEDLVRAVAGVPGVELAVPLVTGVAFPDDGSGELLNVFGVDLGNDENVRVYDPAGQASGVVDDPLTFLSQPDSILIGEEFATHRGLRVGDSLALIVPAGVRRFTVRGLLAAKGIAATIGGRVMVMDVYAAQRVFTTEGRINQVDVVLADGAHVESVRASIAAALPAGARVQEPELRKEVLGKTVAGFQAMMTAFGVLAVLAGFVICYSRLSAIFETRAWEIGLLRAIGLRRSMVFFELLKESVLVGMAGTLLGLPLGFLIGRVGLPMMAETTALNFGLATTSAKPTLTVAHVFLGIAVGAMAAVLAAVLPALRMSGISPVAALVRRGRDVPGPAAGWPRFVIAGFLVVVPILLIVQQRTHAVALGHLTTVAIAIGVCLLARPVVHAGGKLMTPLVKRLFGKVGWFAMHHLRERSTRAGLSVATLGIGLGVVFMFGMLGWSLERTVVSQLAARFRADIVLTSPYLSGGWMAAPVSDQVLADIQRIPDVADLAGQQVRDISFEGRTVTLFSYDAPCFNNRDVCRWPLVRGSLPEALARVTGGQAVLISGSVAARHGLGPGDSIELPSPNGPQRFQIAGIAGQEPANAIIMVRDRYRAGWNDTTIRCVLVHINHAANISLTTADILRQVGQGYRLQALASSAYVDFLGGQVRQAFGVLYVMEAVVFLLVSIGITDALGAQVLERRRELGMMRAVGARRSHLFRMVLTEGLALGLLGLALAVTIGLGLGLFWVRVQFPGLLGWNPDVHIPIGFAALGASLTLLLCTLASLLPSTAAARLRVAEVLRNE